MEKMSVYGVVKKLVGEIQPAGSAHIDTERLNNLHEMCELVELLLDEIIEVSKNTKRSEHSMKKAGEYALHFLNRTLTAD